jgi:DIS3-like exonuclease 2
MLAAALEAEEVIIQGESSLPCRRGKSSQALSLGQSNQLASKCFSGAKATKEATFMPSAQQALASAAIKHKLPGIADLAVIATHCNERKLASRNVKDASDKLYLWTMLKKKQVYFLYKLSFRAIPGSWYHNLSLSFRAGHQYA